VVLLSVGGVVVWLGRVCCKVVGGLWLFGVGGCLGCVVGPLIGLN